jgi:hypothetical protein
MIAQAESKLDLRFPNELRRLLAETNGVERQGGLGVVWPPDRIVTDNIRIPTTNRGADAGNGDQFAFPVAAAGRATRWSGSECHATQLPRSGDRNA